MEMYTWLQNRLAEDNVPGLKWTNKKGKQFRLPAKHLRRLDVSRSDTAVYEVYVMRPNASRI